MPEPIPPPILIPAPSGAAPARPTHAILCGVLIVLAMLAMMFTQTHRQAETKEEGGIGVQFDLYAHIIVAVMQNPHDAATESAALDALKKMAKTPDEKVAYAIVVREVHNAPDLSREPVPDNADEKDPLYAFRRAIWTQLSSEADEQFSALEKHFGWYAKLEESRGKSATDPSRQAVLAQATRPMVIAVIAFIGGGLLALAGVACFVIAIVQLARRQWLIRFRPRAMDVSYLEAFTIYLCVFAGISLTSLFLTNKLGWQFSGAIYLLAILILFWPRIRRALQPDRVTAPGARSWPDWRAAIGLIAPRGIAREIAAGLFGYVAGIPVIVLGIFLSSILIKVSGADATHPIVASLRGPLWIVLLLAALACIYAPIVEELFFRGILLGYLRQRLPWYAAAPLVALLFAAIHPQGWAAIPALASIALVLAAIREWRGSILGSITAHALNNTIVMTVALLLLR
jgi:membrane protease YdiL (CAAX protease family)